MLSSKDQRYHWRGGAAVAREVRTAPVEVIGFGEVEARLVEAMRVQRRLESGGYPFAKDAPWHLMQRERGDWGWLSDVEERAAVMPRRAVSRAEIADAEEAMGWVIAHVRESDRRLVLLAIGLLAGGAARVSWLKLLVPMGMAGEGPGGARGEGRADQLRKRYSRSITRICAALNGCRA